MNWKLIFQLSLFGLAMALGTVWIIPQMVEPFLWLVIFMVCAYFIARVCTRRYFLHGFMVSLFNCVWITAAHIIFCTTYFSHHPGMESGLPAPLAHQPRVFMLIVAPFFGAGSGLVQGLFAFIASKIVKKPAVTAEA